ncbi:MAG: hypothetical protein FJ399_09745 [Verrucomicrobia bacterium]|nr:hypothetical protein [Verrucomicrobiota bacterium]
MGFPPRRISPGKVRSAAFGLAGLIAGVTGSASAVPPRMLLLDGAYAGSDLVVVGERGTVLRSGDHAATWERVAVPSRATLTAVSFAPAPPPTPVRHGWAVGHDAIILLTADAGRTWSRQWQGENLQDSFLDVLALDERRVVAVGAYGLYCSTGDGGRTWTRRRLSADDFHFNRVTRGPGGTLYLAGERGTLLRSTDEGQSWAPIRTSYEGSFYGIMPLDRRTLVAYGLRGHIYRSVDDGINWQPVAAPEPVLLATGLQLKSNYLLLAGQARTLLLSRDYGKTFTPVDPAIGSGVAELIELDGGGLLALGEAGPTLLAIPP